MFDKMHCYDCSMFDHQMSILYIVMERGEMDLAVFFRASKSFPDVLQRHITKTHWMHMLYAVKALHEHGNVNSWYLLCNAYV